MSIRHDKMWSASIDGELSAAEANEFDQSLTQVQKANLASEMTVERVLAERLAHGASCPEDVWQRTLAAAELQASRNEPKRAVRSNWWYGVVAFAAVLALTVAGIFGPAYFAQPNELALLEIAKDMTIAEFSEQGELHGASAAEVNAFLKGHGFDFAMTTTDVQIPGDHHTPRQFLGVNSVENHGEPVMELLFNCCDRPVKVVVAKAGSRTAQEMGIAMAGGQLQMSKHVGNYVASIIGRHETFGLLDYLAVPPSA